MVPTSQMTTMRPTYFKIPLFLMGEIEESLA